MDSIKNAAKAVFGKHDLDYRDSGDQKLAAAISTLDMLRSKPTEMRSIRSAKTSLDALEEFQNEVNSPELDDKIKNLKTYYAYEFKVLLAASSKGHRLHVPSDREIRFLGQR